MLRTACLTKAVDISSRDYVAAAELIEEEHRKRMDAAEGDTRVGAAAALATAALSPCC